MDIKRYDFETCDGCAESCSGYMAQRVDGDYVDYDDHKDKVAELEARIKELEAAQRILIEHNAAKTKLITELEAERNAKQWYPWQDIDVEQQKKEGEAI